MHPRATASFTLGEGGKVGKGGLFSKREAKSKFLFSYESKSN